ncbi:hypothetical protein Pan54_15310 [Rubinisphaera italica]|uniref:Uncharacterized protein n=1 Tax=Rubinisphaera italica TaxID=2527969 RepID=A0A5C5XDF1_9PLAN|nr:hypothetical protein Pan54_15310 [Rubinisphaera italica]
MTRVIKRIEPVEPIAKWRLTKTEIVQNPEISQKMGKMLSPQPFLFRCKSMRHDGMSKQTHLFSPPRKRNER